MAVISHVCRGWRDITLDCSTLWTTVKLLHRGRWPIEFIKRSQNRHADTKDGRLLNLRINLSELGQIDATFSLLFDSIFRIESLYVAASASDLDRGERDPKSLMKRVFKGLKTSEAHVLRSLAFTIIDDGYDDDTTDESDSDSEDRESDGNQEGSSDGERSGTDGRHRDWNLGYETEVNAWQLDSEVEMWDDVDGDGDDDDDDNSNNNSPFGPYIASWEAVGLIAIPSSIFNRYSPPRLTELSVTAPLYICPHTTAFSNITSLSLFDVSEKTFWNVLNDTPLLEQLYVEYNRHFHVPAASPLSAETLVKDLVFLPRLRDLSVRNAYVSTFRRFFYNIFPPTCQPMRRVFFHISARDVMGSTDGERLSRILGPMHRENPIDVAAIIYHDWGSVFEIKCAPSFVLHGQLCDNPDALVGIFWPFRFEVPNVYTVKPATAWLHSMWPENMLSPSHLSLHFYAGPSTRPQKFIPSSHWMDLARRFPDVEHLKVEDPFVLILTALWSESLPLENDVFSNLKTLTITAQEIPPEWSGYRPPSERLGLIRRALRVMGSRRNRGHLRRLVFMECDPSFDEELSAMGELMGVIEVETVWISEEDTEFQRKTL